MARGPGRRVKLCGRVRFNPDGPAGRRGCGRVDDLGLHRARRHGRAHVPEPCRARRPARYRPRYRPGGPRPVRRAGLRPDRRPRAGGARVRHRLPVAAGAAEVRRACLGADGLLAHGAPRHCRRRLQHGAARPRPRARRRLRREGRALCRCAGRRDRPDGGRPEDQHHGRDGRGDLRPPGAAAGLHGGDGAALRRKRKRRGDEAAAEHGARPVRRRAPPRRCCWAAGPAWTASGCSRPSATAATASRSASTA